MPNPSRQVANGEAAGEAIARPKFSRRPASFSRATASSAPIAAPAPTVPPAPTDTTPLKETALALRPPAAPTTTAWQEDARFGVVMLLLVLVVNLALIYGLPLLTVSTPHTPAIPLVTQTKAPSMPDAVGRTGAGVTLYSQPETERRTSFLFDLHNASDQDTLSVSPYDVPVPTARALDSDEQ